MADEGIRQKSSSCRRRIGQRSSGRCRRPAKSLLRSFLSFQEEHASPKEEEEEAHFDVTVGLWPPTGCVNREGAGSDTRGVEVDDALKDDGRPLEVVLPCKVQEGVAVRESLHVALRREHGQSRRLQTRLQLKRHVFGLASGFPEGRKEETHDVVSLPPPRTRKSRIKRRLPLQG